MLELNKEKDTHLERLFKKTQNQRTDVSVLEEFGFDYDYEENIFYSTYDSWQKKYGYCDLYDEAAPLMNMIIDSEPISFDYAGKRWLIEL